MRNPFTYCLTLLNEHRLQYFSFSINPPHPTPPHTHTTTTNNISSAIIPGLGCSIWLSAYLFIDTRGRANFCQFTYFVGRKGWRIRRREVYHPPNTSHRIVFQRWQVRLLLRLLLQLFSSLE